MIGVMDHPLDPEQALKRATQQFRSAFDNAPIGMALVGLQGQWLDVNQALCALVGYSQEELLRLTFQDLTHPDDLDADLALVQEVLAGRRSTYQMHKRYIHADGRVIWALLSVSLATDEDGRPLHFISQIQDFTERRELEEKLRHQAEHDPLTGLANRRRFEQELERQIERSSRHAEEAALAVIDLDSFKEVNDVHGHSAGDKLLAAVAAALHERLRATDVAARIGGDEFAAILIGVDERGAETAAGALTAAIADHARAAGFVASASVGVAMIEPGSCADELFARADRAMYAVKRAARPQAVRAVSAL
jgi:diguanylate cyclase (GGDEF)-like protein/PAS domain S-box-containing protein